MMKLVVYLVYELLCIGSATVFNLTCPDGVSWKLRSKIYCAQKESYHCLHETFDDIYIEQCFTAKQSREGWHTVVSGNLDSEECPITTYSPSVEWSNGSVNCRYRKSLCTEEGQITALNGSPITDRSCRCDYTKQYDFITKPRDPCNCFPTVEDCSCYVRLCSGRDYFLSPDYECKRLNSKQIFSCPLVQERKDDYLNGNTEVYRDKFTIETPRLPDFNFVNVYVRKIIGLVLVSLALPLIAVILKAFYISRQPKSPTKIFHDDLRTVGFFQPTKQQEEMKQAFDRDKHGVHIILEGIKGSGKTQAAHHFCNKMKDKYSIIAKLVASSSEDLTNCMYDLVANKLNVQASRPDDFNIKFETLSKSLQNYLMYKRTGECPCLLLLDDANTHTCNDLLQMLEILKDIKDLDIILTTNNSNLYIQWPNCKRVKFNGMEKGEYMALFGDDFRSASKKDFENLIKNIGNLPLVLNSARTYMLKAHKSVAQYIELVQSEKNPLKFEALSKPEDIMKSQLIPLEWIKHKVNDKGLWNVLMFLPHLMYESVSTTVLETCYFHLQRNMETNAVKRKIDQLVKNCGTFSICHIDKKLLNRINVPKADIEVQEKIEERYLSFHEITIAALQLADTRTDDEKIENEDHYQRNVLLKMFCFEIDIDARTDLILQRNFLFLDHAKKLLTLMEPELENKSVTNEKLFCISYLHCAIGSTLLFQRTKIESAHIHLVKARRVFLKIVGQDSDFKEETCTLKKSPTKFIKSPPKETIEAVVEQLSHTKLDPKFVEEFVLQNRRSKNDIDAINKETKKKLKDENYLQKDEYLLLVQQNCALSVEDLQSLLLFELFLRILLNNGRALNELKYLKTEEHLQSAIAAELNTANENCKLIKERYNKFELFVCIQNDMTGRMLMRWNQTEISTNELDQDILFYEELLKRPFPSSFNFGVLKMSTKASDRHICTCYRIILRALITKHKLTQDETEREKIYEKGHNLLKQFAALLEKIEKKSYRYTWIFLPVLHIQCAKFLLLSSNPLEIKEAKSKFEKAISLEESRGVFWTRVIHEGYHGLLCCLNKLGKKKEADKILINVIKSKLQEKNRDHIISMLKNLKYDNWV